MSETAQGASSAPAESSAPVESSDSSVDTSVDTGMEAGAEGSEQLTDALEQAQEAVQQAEAKAAKEEAKRLGKKRLGLKVNGREQELELDLDNDAELTKYMQKAMAADERMNEAAGMRKQLQQFVQALKSDPLSILQHPELGLDLKKIAEQVINGEIEEMQKTPEQREKERLQKELEEAKQLLQAEQEAKRNAEIARLEEQAFIQLDKEIDEALSTAEIPRSSYVVKRLADAMIQATDLGYTDVSVKDVLPFVQKQMQEEMQELFGRLPEEAIERIMGPNLDRVRKKKVAQVKKAQAASQGSPTQVKESAAGAAPKQTKEGGEPVKKIKAKEFFKPW
jgi:hypothetical protein